MRQDIEDAVEKYQKDHNMFGNYKGAAESNLRFWGRMNYYNNFFKKSKNVNLFKEWIQVDSDLSNYNESLDTGRMNILYDPEGCVNTRNRWKHIRYEMWRRGMVDGVYDRWNEYYKDILERIKNMPEVNSPDFKYVDGRDKDGKRIKS